MKVCLRPALSAVAAVLLCVSAAWTPSRAVTISVQGCNGAFFSPATTGLQFSTRVRPEGTFHSLSAALQMTGVIGGRYSRPGYVLSYHRCFTLGQRTIGKGYPLRIYCGPGVTAGFVRERRSARGAIGGVSAVLGGRVDMMGGFVLGLEWQVSAALRHDSDSAQLTAYMYPLQYFWQPRLMISKYF